MNTQEMIDALKAQGYVVLKEKSYRQAQERQRVADSLRRYADQMAEHAREWAKNCLYDERRIYERLMFVWGVAIRHGATLDELEQDPVTRPPRQDQTLGANCDPDHPYTDPGDGRPQCDVCGKFVWPAIHSCKGVRVAPVDPEAVQFPDWKPRSKR